MKLHKTAGNGQKQKRASGKAGSPKSSVGGNFPEISGISENHEQWSRGDSNPRPVAENKGKQGIVNEVHHYAHHLLHQPTRTIANLLN